MKFKILAGIITAVFVLAMNLQYALSEYGILENNLHGQVLAQTTGGDSGTGGAGSATNAGGSGTGTAASNGKCKKTESCKYRKETKIVGTFPWLIKIEVTWETGTEINCVSQNCPPNSSCYTPDEKPCGP